MREEDRWRQAVERLTSFNRILRAASSSIYLNTSFGRMSDEIQRILAHDRASIAFVDAGTDLAFVYGVNGQDSSLGVGTVVPIAGSNVGEVIKTLTPMFKTDIAKEDNFAEKEKLLAMGIRSNVTVPVFRGGIAVASLNFGSFQVGRFQESDVQNAQEIADNIGDVIANARDVQEALNLKLAQEVTDENTLQSSRGLTQRELEVLTLLSAGSGNKEIAGILGISNRTVRFHIENIYEKLGVRNRTQAVRAAQQYRLIAV